MIFSLESSAVWGFTYNANLLKSVYTGKTAITNPSTEATFYGKFLSFSSYCADLDFAFIDSWFESSGLLARCLAFHYIPLAGLDCDNGLVWKAFISDANTPILKSYYKGVLTPYHVTSIYPITSTTATISGENILGTPGTQIDLDFKFKIIPENPRYNFTKKGNIIQFAEIPFMVIPRKIVVPPPLLSM